MDAHRKERLGNPSSPLGEAHGDPAACVVPRKRAFDQVAREHAILTRIDGRTTLGEIEAALQALVPNLDRARFPDQFHPLYRVLFEAFGDACRARVRRRSATIADAAD